MDFRLTPDQNALRERVAALCRAHCTPAQEAARDRSPAYPEALHRAMAESGVLGHCLPKPFGGAGGTAVDLCVIAEELGRHSSAATNILFVNSICGALIAFGGSNEQKQNYVGAIARGEARFAFALSEPGTGSDAASVQARALRDGDHYVVNGTKLYTTGAADADFIVTVVRTGDDPKGNRALSLLVIPARTPGVTIARLDKIASNDVASCRVELRDVRVDAGSLVGQENQGWSLLMVGGGLERLIVAASCAGAAQAALDEVLAHVRAREQFGQPVVRFQAVQHQLADMATSIEAMRLLTYSAAWRMAQGLMPIKEVSMAKLFASEGLNGIVTQGMRLIGAPAYLSETAMPRRLRESLLAFYAGGTMEIQRNIIAKSLGV